ncbi:MAG: hypothetical protein CXZ00_03990 [Acidobacteria bacterium]|nr:MAG: hypothetical protein CXZ00_03990 [Acidobacteriota bacterium]
MGFFDSMKEKITGQAAGQKLPSMLMGMLGGGDTISGLQQLVQLFQEKGLGGVVSSWIGTGSNLPISGEQLQSVLGSERVQQLADRLGLSPEMVKEQLAQHLPHAVDKMTPEGKLPEKAA